MTLRTKATKRVRALSPVPVRRPSKKARSTTSCTLINSLSTAPARRRPALTLFGWGCGDTGQLGLGHIPFGAKDEWDEPTRNNLVESMVREGVFGEAGGAGLVAIATGGMHSLVIDEDGTVMKNYFAVAPSHLLSGVVLWYQR